MRGKVIVSLTTLALIGGSLWFAAGWTERRSARLACEESILSALASPGSARITMRRTTPKPASTASYEFDLSVDAQNLMGALLRQEFTCVASLDPRMRWHERFLSDAWNSEFAAVGSSSGARILKK